MPARKIQNENPSDHDTKCQSFLTLLQADCCNFIQLHEELSANHNPVRFL